MQPGISLWFGAAHCKSLQCSVLNQFESAKVAASRAILLSCAGRGSSTADATRVCGEYSPQLVSGRSPQPEVSLHFPEQGLVPGWAAALVELMPLRTPGGCGCDLQSSSLAVVARSRAGTITVPFLSTPGLPTCFTLSHRLQSLPPSQHSLGGVLCSVSI